MSYNINVHSYQAVVTYLAITIVILSVQLFYQLTFVFIYFNLTFTHRFYITVILTYLVLQQCPVHHEVVQRNVLFIIGVYSSVLFTIVVVYSSILFIIGVVCDPVMFINGYVPFCPVFHWLCVQFCPFSLVLFTVVYCPSLAMCILGSCA